MAAVVGRLGGCCWKVSAPSTSRSQESKDKRTVSTIQGLLAHDAISKAIGRVKEPMRFARGEDVPERLQNMFPRPPPAIQAQSPHEDIPVELRQELVAHIAKELSSLPRMCGAGANGSYYEHLALHSHIHGGIEPLADVLADLLTGEAPLQAVEALRSGRARPPLKPGSDVDIRPLVAASAQWRTAMLGWSAMFADEARIAVGDTQFGVARPGGGDCFTPRDRDTNVCR